MNMGLTLFKISWLYSSPNFLLTMKYPALIFSVIASIAPTLSFAQGSLENPVNGSTESGIGIISGWHCTASKIDVLINGNLVGYTFTGSTRNDTTAVCNGKASTGFSYLINFNDLPAGANNIMVLSDGVKFGESTFNTTQSGGQGFLRGVTKQTTVPDFPSAGANATLTWNQAKQSFVVTSIQAGTQPAPITGIGKLYGDVTFTYKFSGSSTIYTDRVSFSASNLNSAGVLSATLKNRSATIGCSRTQSSPEFACLISTSLSSWMDAFSFDISGTGAISGKYEYCYSVSDCTYGLVYNADGIVSGAVARTLSTKSIRPENDASKINDKDEQLLIETETQVHSVNTDEEVERLQHITETLNRVVEK